jgi:hypothetical protein
VVSILIVPLLGSSACAQEVRAVRDEPKTLLGHDQFGLRYFPDMPTCTISQKPLTFLMAVKCGSCGRNPNAGSRCASGAAVRK